MAKKKTSRPSPFPLHFWEGNREIAQKRADEDTDGNLTAWINAIIVYCENRGKRRSKRTSK